MKNIITIFLIALISFAFLSEVTFSQSDDTKYRTFDQASLGVKQNKLKEYASKWCYELTNNTGQTVNGLRLTFSAAVTNLSETGTFINVAGYNSKTLELTGTTIGIDQVINICGKGNKKQMSLVKYIWLDNGNKIGKQQKPSMPTFYQRLLPMPNFGWVRRLTYNMAYTSKGGLLVGVERYDSSSHYAWLRFMNGAVTVAAFPHIAPPRGFDTFGKAGHTQQPFRGPKKNFKVWKHDNHLLGEIHALKIGVTANDVGLSEPTDTLITALGDLLFNDLTDPTNPFNNKTIREILLHADSAMTMYTWFPVNYHRYLDSIISIINGAFIGDMDTVSTNPLVVKGAVALSSVPFLHPNVTVKRLMASGISIPEIPDEFVIYQNYPNPFNPSTTIDFNLPEDAIVSLKVYNTLGQETANIIDREYLDSGYHTYDFEAGSLVSGIYYYIITVEGSQSYKTIKKMILLK